MAEIMTRDQEELYYSGLCLKDPDFPEEKKQAFKERFEKTKKDILDEIDFEKIATYGELLTAFSFAMTEARNALFFEILEQKK